MILSPTHRSTFAGLLRLVAAWLAAILVMQAFQGALALGAGPRHSHRATVGTPAGHLHLNLERHYHASTDASVIAADPVDTGADASALALTIALALMVMATPHRLAGPQGHVLHAARAWFWRSRSALPLLKPPRSA